MKRSFLDYLNGTGVFKKNKNCDYKISTGNINEDKDETDYEEMNHIDDIYTKNTIKDLDKKDVAKNKKHEELVVNSLTKMFKKYDIPLIAEHEQNPTDKGLNEDEIFETINNNTTDFSLRPKGTKNIEKNKYWGEIKHGIAYKPFNLQFIFKNLSFEDLKKPYDKKYEFTRTGKKGWDKRVLNAISNGSIFDDICEVKLTKNQVNIYNLIDKELHTCRTDVNEKCFNDWYFSDFRNYAMSKDVRPYVEKMDFIKYGELVCYMFYHSGEHRGKKMGQIKELCNFTIPNAGEACANYYADEKHSKYIALDNQLYLLKAKNDPLNLFSWFKNKNTDIDVSDVLQKCIVRVVMEEMKDNVSLNEKMSNLINEKERGHHPFRLRLRLDLTSESFNTSVVKKGIELEGVESEFDKKFFNNPE